MCEPEVTWLTQLCKINTGSCIIHSMSLTHVIDEKAENDRYKIVTEYIGVTPQVHLALKHLIFDFFKSFL